MKGGRILCMIQEKGKVEAAITTDSLTNLMYVPIHTAFALIIIYI